MGQVQNNSSIVIQKANSSEPFSNKLFNGYVYNLSLAVGFHGELTRLTLNLALNKTSKTGKSRLNARSTNFIDSDFEIIEDDIGLKSSYNIFIKNAAGEVNYQLYNFKIINFSISKKDNEKILTLTLVDNSIVLDKIFVGLLGEHVAIDYRTATPSSVLSLPIYCPSVGLVPAQMKAASFSYNAHTISTKTLSDRYKSPFFKTFSGRPNFNYLILASEKTSINNGYGAVILLGEEEFKDADCSNSNTTYSFDTLLAAMLKLGIEVESLWDKSLGQIKRNFSGTLKDVLKNWCDLYSFSYSMDYSIDTSINKIKIYGIDLSNEINKRKIEQIKLNLENLEKDPASGMVIQSQDIEYDLSQKNLKLYSSFYFKEAKDKSSSREQLSRSLPFYNMNLRVLFPDWFGKRTGKSWSKLDFCGAARTYEEVITSAVLGKFSPKLRQIYNYKLATESDDVRTLRALGFIYINRLVLGDDKEMLIGEAVAAMLEIEYDNLFPQDERGNKEPAYYHDFGLYNQDLVNQIERIESFIVDFIGKHYWTDTLSVNEGSSSNSVSFSESESSTMPSTEKVYSGETYSLKIFQEARFLTAEISSIFSGTKNLFDAYEELNKAKEEVEDTCKKADNFYTKALRDNNTDKKLRFYGERAGATYNVYEEFIRDLEVFKFSVSNHNEIFQINLADMYAPGFKELSPVSLGALQSALMTDMPSRSVGDFKFGILYSRKESKYIIPTIQDPIYTNQIEFQNQIKRYCEAVTKGSTAEIDKIKKNIKHSCNKTILYQICIYPAEKETLDQNNAAEIQSAFNGDPRVCYGIPVRRDVPNEKVILKHLSEMLTSNVFLSLTTKQNKQDDFRKKILKHDSLTQGGPYSEKDFFQSLIILPSQTDYYINLLTKSNSEIFIPSQNFIEGGLESNDDIRKIVENEGFSVSVFVNNVTPNVRELFGEESSPSYVFNTTVASNGSPSVISYKGQNDNNAIYEYFTFRSFHNKLKAHYDSKAVSVLGSAMTYSVELFCNLIDERLKNILSTTKGLTSLNISFGSGGLNVKCQFANRPALETQMETLIHQNKPNIRYINNYYTA